MSMTEENAVFEVADASREETYEHVAMCRTLAEALAMVDRSGHGLCDCDDDQCVVQIRGLRFGFGESVVLYERKYVRDFESEDQDPPWKALNEEWRTGYSREALSVAAERAPWLKPEDVTDDDIAQCLGSSFTPFVSQGLIANIVNHFNRKAEDAREIRIRCATCERTICTTEICIDGGEPVVHCPPCPHCLEALESLKDDGK